MILEDAAKVSTKSVSVNVVYRCVLLYKCRQENADIQEVKSKRSSLVPRTCGRRILWARYKLECQDKRNQRKLQARVSLQTFTFKPIQNSWRKYYLVDMDSQLFSQLSWRGKVKEVSLQVATANRPEFCLYPSMGLIDR